MSPIQVNRMLQEMRALQAQAAGAAAPAATAPQGGFAATLKEAVGSANRQQIEASQKADTFLAGGNVPLTEVMVAMQKSKVSFEAVKQVRNHLLDAYQEVSRMQI